MSLTPESLRLCIVAAVVIAFGSLAFCLYVLVRSREDASRTQEAILLFAVSLLTVYGSLHLTSSLPPEPALWKFSLLAGCAGYLLFNVLTFPTDTRS